MGDALKSQQENFQSNLSGLLDKIGKGDDDDDSSSRNPTYNDDDLETMSRKEFLGVITSSITKDLKPVFEDVRKEINATRTESAKDRVIREYKELKSEKKDLDQWQEEIKIQLKKNPSLSIGEAYTLARSGDNEKAKKMDEEFKMGSFAETDSKDGKNKEGGFGGMRPDAGSRSEQRSDMTKEESSEKAWDDIFGGREQELLAGEIPNSSEAA